MTDDDGGAGVETFDVTVLNVPPNVNTEDSSLTIEEGGTVTSNGTFFDPGWDSVSISSSSGTVTQHAVPTIALGTFADSGQALGDLEALAVAVGDLDSDGDLDAYVGHNGGNRVWLNDGNGTFVDSGQRLGAAWTLGVALGDLDGDGDLDAFDGNIGSNRVWLNNGIGTFSDSSQMLGSEGTEDVKLSDIDRDGDLDAVTANNPEGIRVWLNNGHAVFANSGQVFMNHRSRSVAVGDVDGDGDLDALEVTVGLGAADRLWLNNGSGIFADSGQIVGATWTSDAALGDVDLDGDLDAFVAAAEPNRVWFNDGSGVFSDGGQALGTSESWAVALGDVDLDGDLDAFIGDTGPDHVWLNDGAGHFSDSGQVLGSFNNRAICLGDLDGDGDLDAIDGNRVWINQGSGLLGSSGEWSWSLDTSDGPSESQTVTITADDGDGGVAVISIDVTVLNVAPAVFASGPTSGVPGEPLPFLLRAGDISAEDMGALFEYAIDWESDGIVDEVRSGPWTMQISHAFPDKGTYTVTVTAADKDGGVSSPVSWNVAVTHAALSNGTLKVGGSNAPDRIVVRKGSVIVTINEEIVGTFESADSLLIYGLAGDDEIAVDDLIEIPTCVNAGDGNDHVQGGGGQNTLVGGPGDDVLVAGAGDNTLNGGDGSDTLIASTGGNTLDGGDGDDVFYDGGGTNTVFGGEGNNTFVPGGGQTTFPPETGDVAPTVFSDAYQLAEGLVLSVPAAGVLANDIAPDGGQLQAGVVTGPTHGTLSLSLDGSFTYAPNAGFNGQDSFAYIASSSSLQSSAALVTINVVNLPPSVAGITAPLDPVSVSTTDNVTASADFTDPGTLDTHAAVWTWDDGTTSLGIVSAGSESKFVTGSHAYATPGVYQVELTVTDGDGGVDAAVFEYVVVNDPNGGFVTGGGWIMSPVGAYVSNPDLTGRANFGFVSRYQKGAAVPTGVTEFQFKVADLNFHSEVYDWLVVAGADAKYKGVGTINGAGDYKFMLTAHDAQATPQTTDVDTFRIKIWQDVEGTESVVYDNKLGVADDSYVGTDLGGGSIVVHKSGTAQTVAAAPAATMAGMLLTEADLAAALDLATGHWASRGGDLDVLRGLDIRVAGLDGRTLGLASTSTNLIWIDRDAAGYGWSLSKDAVQPGAVDLLSTLTHELGHHLGYGHDVMGDALPVGVRQLLLAELVAAAAPVAMNRGDAESSVRDRIFAGDLDDEDEPGRAWILPANLLEDVARAFVS